MAENFLTSWVTVNFSRRTLIAGVSWLKGSRKCTRSLWHKLIRHSEIPSSKKHVVYRSLSHRYSSYLRSMWQVICFVGVFYFLTDYLSIRLMFKESLFVEVKRQYRLDNTVYEILVFWVETSRTSTRSPDWRSMQTCRSPKNLELRAKYFILLFILRHF